MCALFGKHCGCAVLFVSFVHVYSSMCIVGLTMCQVCALLEHMVQAGLGCVVGQNMCFLRFPMYMSIFTQPTYKRSQYYYIFDDANSNHNIPILFGFHFLLRKIIYLSSTTVQGVGALHMETKGETNRITPACLSPHP